MCALAMTAERGYHLPSEEANRQLDVLLEPLRVPEASWRLYAKMLTSVLKLFEDGAEVADLKITPGGGGAVGGRQVDVRSQSRTVAAPGADGTAK